MMKTSILILNLLFIIGCSQVQKNELTERDKAIIVNLVINNNDFYNSLSEIYRDSVPTLVISKYLSKALLSKVRYHNKYVNSSKIDSTDLSQWKSDWKHPQFFIDFERFERMNDNVFIEIRVRSTGVYGEVVAEYVNGEWKIKKQSYGKT